jgi:uncharacterized membrane protein
MNIQERENPMFIAILDFANMLLAALLVGAIFGIWLILNPVGVDASSYVVLQQQAIRAVNKVMPALGAATILLTLGAAVFGRNDSTRFRLLLATVICFVVVGLVTRFLNQPINAIVMTWKKESPPADWTVLRDQWWRWHLVRLGTSVTGLCLLIVSLLKRSWAG